MAAIFYSNTNTISHTDSKTICWYQLTTPASTPASTPGRAGGGVGLPARHPFEHIIKDDNEIILIAVSLIETGVLDA